MISVTNSSGALLAINDYDEFGVPGSGNLGAWGYTGQAWIAAIGVQYSKARMYDPELGRFLQTDPIEYAGGMNLYAYVLNDPVNLIDPLGLGGCDGTDPTADCTDIFVTGSGCSGFWIGDYCASTGDLQRMFNRISVGGPGRGGPGRKSPPLITRLAIRLVCEIESFGGGADFALGVGPVLRGSLGLEWNQKTGQVSFYRSIGVGFGAAFAGGLGGIMSNQARSSGYSKTKNAQLALGGGLSVAHSSLSETSVSVSAGPRLAVELSETENLSDVDKLYVAGKGADCSQQSQ